MKSKILIVMLGTALAFPGVVLAQTASESMHQAGIQTEQAADDTGHALVDTYHGAKTATIDTTITAKVKTALDRNDTTKHQDIHVKTQAGIVTLRGDVSSARVADQAVRVTDQVTGVKGVRNRMVVATASR
ncbi:MAG TPA: BON domain-containing protein [Candidatus Binataceae bacterium]|nr:BON domain-containing protein [Candidatus Binataceae bacterium]